MIDEKIMLNIVEHLDFTTLFKETTLYVRSQLQEKLTRENISGIDTLYLTGCGDSLFEAMAAVPVFEKYAGLRTEALEALEFSKYRVGFLKPGTAVFCISNSGGASRTIETIRAANTAGVFSVAVSGNDQSILAKESSILIHRPVGQIAGVAANCGRVVRNLAEYLICLHVLYLTAFHLGVLRGVITEKQQEDLVEMLLRQPQNILKTARENAAPLCNLVERMREEDTLFFLGAGPNYATAKFGAAKLHEDVPLNGVGEWLEEWAHLQYFLSLCQTHKSPICVISPPGKSYVRAQEIIASARELGVPVVQVLPVGETVGDGIVPLKIVGNLPEEFTPLLYCVPLQLLGIYWALELGAQSVPLSRTDDYKLIRGSEIQVDYLQ